MNLDSVVSIRVVSQKSRKMIDLWRTWMSQFFGIVGILTTCWASDCSPWIKWACSNLVWCSTTIYSATENLADLLSDWFVHQQIDKGRTAVDHLIRSVSDEGNHGWHLEVQKKDVKKADNDIQAGDDHDLNENLKHIGLKIKRGRWKNLFASECSFLKKMKKTCWIYLIL